jgi:hypothetical protein
VPPLLIDTEEEQRICDEAHKRRERRLARRAEAGTITGSAKS